MDSSPHEAGHTSDGSREEDTQRRLLNAAVRHSRLDVNELWMYYFSLGGSAGEYEIEAFLNASYSLPAMERDLLAHAVNEMIDMISPPPRAPYSFELQAEGQTKATHDRAKFGRPDDDTNS